MGMHLFPPVNGTRQDNAKTVSIAMSMPSNSSSLKNDAAARAAHQELVNAITHGFGLLLSLVAAVLLVRVVVARGDTWLVLGATVYSASLVAVYAASTLSHCVQRPRRRQLLRAWDQGLIYLLIAGTYTPFALAYLRTGWWWLLIVLMWVLALAGFVSKVVKQHRVEGISTLTYVVLGWIPMLGIGPVLSQAPPGAIFWAGVGAACYLVGILFLISDHKAIYLHAVWHIFVIAGSAFQFFGIYRCMVA